jgi:hypothetical protein
MAILEVYLALAISFLEEPGQRSDRPEHEQLRQFLTHHWRATSLRPGLVTSAAALKFVAHRLGEEYHKL